MHIDVRYFAATRDLLGSGEQLSWAAGDDVPRTVGDLLQCLQARSSAHAAALDLQRGLRCALNQAMCALDEPLLDGAEVAFFPPVTGG